MGIGAAIGGGALLGGVGGALSSGDKTTTATRTVNIPDILKPLVNTQTGLNADALTRLMSLLAPGNEGRLVAPFDPLQTEGQNAAVDIARGGGGFIPAAQEGLLATARGDNLYGSPGFNAAVDASIRAARPYILSNFGHAGGRPGGLANVAIQQSASDAFARLFDTERNRQQAAQLALPGAGLLPSDILTNIGGARQQQTQREQLSPIEAINILLDASRAGGINLNALLGSTATSTQEGIGPLAGGLLGALGGAQTGGGLFNSLSGSGGGGGFARSQPYTDAQWAQFLAGH